MSLEAELQELVAGRAPEPAPGDVFLTGTAHDVETMREYYRGGGAAIWLTLRLLVDEAGSRDRPGRPARYPSPGDRVAVVVSGADYAWRPRAAEGELEQERDLLRARVRDLGAAVADLRARLGARGGLGFDPWEVGLACGGWFAALAARGGRFSLLEVD